MIHACTLKEFGETVHYAYHDGGSLAQTDYDPTNTEMTALLVQRHSCQLAASSFPHTNEPVAVAIVLLFLLGWTLFALVGGLIVSENNDTKVLSGP